MFLLQGQYVMLRDPAIRGFHMFDTSCGRILWSLEDTPNFAEANNDYEVFLTESFCGLLCRYDYYDPMDFPECGYYHLRIYDNNSGREIYGDRCGDFRYHEEYGREEVQFAAEGNYLLVYCPELNRDSPVMTVMCVKVDPMSKTCLVRRTSVGLGRVLLRKLVQDDLSERTEEKSSDYMAPEITYGQLRILGFAFESIVTCHAQVNYQGPNLTYIGVDMIFSMDLEKILDTFEPSSLFSALHFPLGNNVLTALKEKHNNTDRTDVVVSSSLSGRPRYYPYYQTTENRGGQGRVRLSGIIEISNNKSEPLMPKVHTFMREWVRSEGV